MLDRGVGADRDGAAAAAGQPGAGQEPHHRGEVQQAQGRLSEAQRGAHRPPQVGQQTFI